ncbi:Gfo/Idh/MocA family oxidoreductase [Paenibacillus aurantius]|uniref:Gfo/Idh/MocA family oxidoreductase n=1 Tax=Paenibacillus aurantius TaxID=2918900 RepID=A0AA96L8L7_9BACL|nr:Gfo/Idh/MocA family oxidoreductase [Paenibacillus aurantius]WNQ09051.1 Gfo/Idh/MocA family oxidoreductase [Paenibacillus aurantius]
MSEKVLKIGLIGLGRSGRNIHGNLLAKLPELYRITAAADSLEDRRKLAEEEYGCTTYADWRDMAKQEELDLIVNASPSHQHVPITLELLNAGHNVLCEKPLARTTEEIDSLIEASERSGKLLAAFQQSRYNPAFTQVRKVIESGVLGRIVQIDFTSSGFARRWDWQTLQSNNGGNLLNTGPHPVDQALQLFGGEEMPEVVCVMDRANTFGDAEDYVKLLLKGEGRPTIDLEISSCSVFPRDAFVVHGTNGGLRGNGQKLEWKYFKPEEAPEQKLEREPLMTPEGRPAYCSEQLTWHTGSWQESLPEDRTTFEYMTEELYRMLYRTLVNGEPLEITPQQVRRQMAVMEECRRQNPQIYKEQVQV